jgi:hypothetical protein
LSSQILQSLDEQRSVDATWGDGKATYLHQTTSHVSRLCSLDGGIDQTFTTRNGVKQEFVWGETTEETVPHETFRGWLSVLLLEMRKGSIVETVRYTLSGDNLLTD